MGLPIMTSVGYASGGEVKGPGGPTDDKVGPVMLSDGEYVLPADTVRAVGKENLDKLKDATHEPTNKAQRRGMLRRMADGGGADVMNDEKLRKRAAMFAPVTYAFSPEAAVGKLVDHRLQKLGGPMPSEVGPADPRPRFSSGLPGVPGPLMPGNAAPAPHRHTDPDAYVHHKDVPLRRSQDEGEEPLGNGDAEVP
jgi:hypothetical protein